MAELAPKEVEIGPLRLKALLGIPENPKGLVIFAHGSGSGRLSPRNNKVAAALRNAGLATLLLDLLSPAEERDRANVFDIELLASRLVMAAEWAASQPRLQALKIGYFGASTGGGAALVAATRPAMHPGAECWAVVSRGGRPDLAGAALPKVRAPTLLLVGGLDEPVIALNKQALDRLDVEKKLIIVPGATHLFEEPGTMEQVIGHATEWFLKHLSVR